MKMTEMYFPLGVGRLFVLICVDFRGSKWRVFLNPQMEANQIFLDEGMWSGMLLEASFGRGMEGETEESLDSETRRG